MLEGMAYTTTVVRPVESQPDDAFERLCEQALGLATQDGHSPLLFPDLCIYRSSTPTTYNKAATFGVTLGVVLQGAKRIRFRDHEVTLNRAQVIVVTRESEHRSSIFAATQQRPYVGLSLCFGPERVARALLALAEAGGATSRESMPAFTMNCAAEIAEALGRLLRTLGDPLDRKLLAPLVTDEILYHLLRSDAAAAVRAGVGPAADAHRILDVMRFMRENHTDKLSVKELARRTAMSASHFAHRFRAVARVSPMRYLREVRLEAARLRLLRNDARVSEIAVDVGFESPAHFTREFKRRFGVAPSKALATLTPTP